MADFADELHFALHLADLAGREILPRFRRVSTEYKADGSEVTEADRRAEAVIREALAAHDPEAAVLGEEFGGEARPLAGAQWVIDPLDGTTPFTLGVPLFGTLIGLLVDGEPVVGVIHLPALGETVWATRGGGCWFGLAGSVEKPQRVEVAPPVPLERAFVSTTGAHGSDLRERPGEPRFQLGAVIRAAGRFRFVGDCMQHALVCRGRLHAAIDTIMSPWDTAALIPCLREAGAVATALTGEPDNVVFSGSLLASCDVDLHREIVALIN